MARPPVLSKLRGRGANWLVGSPTGTRWEVASSLPVSYSVRTSWNLFDPDNDDLETEAFAGSSRRRLVIVEQKVFDLYGTRLRAYLRRRGLQAQLVPLAADETLKDQRLAARVVDAVCDFGLDRRAEPIIVVGGGTLMDVVGWVAATYRRGTPYIRIPTTLVGLVDASVGIKTAVNYKGQKNLIGSYHAPQSVLLDPSFLRTLPTRHISNGLAEVAKIGLVCDARLWKLLTEQSAGLVHGRLGSSDPVYQDKGREILSRAIHGMLCELQPNLWEKDLSRLVDFGHTFSPALEMAALPDLLHGEAVSIDMALSCALSQQRGLLGAGALEEIIGTLVRLALPIDHRTCTVDLLEVALARTVRHRGGRQRMPVPVEPGVAEFLDDVSRRDLAEALRQTRELGKRLS